MKLLIKIPFLLCFLIIIGSSNKEQVCIISGSVIDRPESKVLLLAKAFDDLRSSEIIKIPIIEGKFTYELNYSNIEVYMLVFDEEHTAGAWKEHHFFPTNGKIDITLYRQEKETENEYIGGQENENHKAYKEEFHPKEEQFYDFYELKFDSLAGIDQYYSDTAKTIKKLLNQAVDYEEEKKYHLALSSLYQKELHLSKEAKAINDELKEGIKEINAQKLSFLEEKPSIATYFLLTRCIYQNKKHSEYYNDDDLERLEKKFMSIYADHPYTHQLLQIESAVKIGGKYQDFNLPDITGQQYQLSNELKGKYAIIDIWAPWCGPCLKKSKALKTTYDEYKDKGFQVIGVASKYHKIDDVQKILEKEQHPWVTLIDEPDWKSEINFKYDILNAGGVMVFTDSEGKIMAINPSMEHIREVLAKNLD
ncbi:peroxiredoxin family protein [Flexithrix dorotheae]|uniref:peroxiredoxin family protein n=1 Tax=Flexithrix dorotheae TaxID=70993 RepID=UPI0003750A30|nr:TlpA disulfide reductase family protein [Flexithrix dorotheae]